jgi:type IV pilus assembly protein PilO
MKKKQKSREGLEPLFRKIADLTKLQRILICAAVVILLLVIFGFFSYLPKYERIDRLKTDIKSSEQKLSITKRKAAQYESVKKEHEKAKAGFELAARALPDKEEIPSLLTGISQAGKVSGLVFILFQPQAEEIKDFYAEIPVKMELSGKYHDLGSFYDRIARLSRIVNIKDFSIKGDSGNPGNTLKIACTAVTYKFIDQPAAQDKNDKNKKKKR